VIPEEWLRAIREHSPPGSTDLASWLSESERTEFDALLEPAGDAEVAESLRRLKELMDLAGDRRDAGEHPRTASSIPADIADVVDPGVMN
jgi:hypothetical protein